MIISIIAIIILIAFIIEKSYNKIKITEKTKTEQLTQISENDSYITTEKHLTEIEDSYNNGHEQGYAEGYTEGYAAGQNNTGTIEYTYHVHGDGYCNSEPIYHQHTGKTGSCYKTNICGGSLRQINKGSEHTYMKCYTCEKSCDLQYSKCPQVTGYTLICGKTTSTIDSYKCTVTEGSIVSATIKFK